jgi:hypothetical protein
VRIRTLIGIVALAPTLAAAEQPAPFEARASFVPASSSTAPAAIRLVLRSKDDDLRVSGRPWPGLRLSAAQRSLTLVGPAPEATGEATPGPRYVDLDQPLRFPVKLNTAAPPAPHAVEATLSFVYCSTSKGWCRKATQRVEIPVEEDR